MFKIALSVLVFALYFAFPAQAQDQCTAAPTIADTAGACNGGNERIVNNKCVCDVPVGGGTCSFDAGEDGIVDFPDNAAVTEAVAVQGGRNIHIGGDLDAGGKLGGYMLYSPPVGTAGNRQGFSFKDSSASAGTKYMEGMHIDVNGNCDQIAIQTFNSNNQTITLVNNFTKGGGYNIVADETGSYSPGDCHGDIIQQQGSSPVDITLNVENFAAEMNYYGGGNHSQGIFIPWYGSGTFNVNFTNVYVRTDAGASKPQMWFSESGVNPYPVTLTNTWSAGPASKLWPTSRIDTNGFVTWPPGELITGGVNMGSPLDPVDLAYPGKTGLNYDRAYFCDVSEVPHSHSELVTKAQMKTACLKEKDVARCTIWD